MLITIIFDAAFLSLLVIAGYFDIKTRLIPAWITIVLLALAIAHMAAVWSLKPLYGLLPAILIYALLYDNGKGMGGADIQIIGCMGLYFGLSFQLIIALLTACVGAVVWHSLRRLKSGQKNENVTFSIPFCAFLAGGSAAGVALTIGGML